MQLKLLRAVLDRALSDGHIGSVTWSADLGGSVNLNFKLYAYEGEFNISITPGAGLKDVQTELYNEILTVHRNA